MIRAHLKANDCHAAEVVEFRLHPQVPGCLGGAALLVDVRRLGAVEGVAAAAGQGSVLLLEIVLRSLQAAAAEECVDRLHPVVAVRLPVKQVAHALRKPAHQLLPHRREGEKVRAQRGYYQTTENQVLKKRQPYKMFREGAREYSRIGNTYRTPSGPRTCPGRRLQTLPPRKGPFHSYRRARPPNPR